MKRNEIFPTDWDEPAHPMVLRFRDDLIAIYTIIREKFQDPIDKVFDNISRQIGFVVTTSVPVIVDVGRNGKITSIRMAAENMKGTLFDKELTKVIRGIMAEPIPFCAAGTYNIHLFWFEALNLRLRRDWVEPAHVVRPVGQLEKQVEVVSDFKEPAHWFDPRIAIAAEEMVLISAINDVYPELKLEERIASNRKALRE